MIERLKRRVRPKAQEKIDNLVGEFYVREERFDTAMANLERLLADRFDAEAEVSAIFGTRVSALADAVEALHDDLRALRADVAALRAAVEGESEGRRSHPAPL
jgi:chromosome segregation ATPase